MHVLELVASVFGLLCVYLTVRQNIWCWPTGLVQVTPYTIIFYEAKLYSDAILQVVYLVLQFYGWYHWLHGGAEKATVPITRLSQRALFGWLVVSASGSVLWGFGMAHFTDAALPYPDAVVVVLSLVAQWLLVRKNLEAWHFWIAVDLVAIGVYFAKQLYVTTGLYFVFLVLAILGLLRWKKEHQQQLA